MLTINGTNFVAASMVNFAGTARTTTFVNSTQLAVAIPAAAIASAGTAAVTATNPAPGGGASNAVNFAITGGTNPVPIIDFLSPSGVAVGGPAFSLTVFGSNFLASSVVRWNGNDRLTTFASSSEVTAQIPASDIAATGTAAITVFNPEPSAGTSHASTFTIATGGVYPNSVAGDPSGKFAYVANLGDFVAERSGLSMYTINATSGVLTPTGTIDAFTPVSVAVAPSGKFAYVANFGFNTVSMYSIDAGTGALTLIGTIGT